MSRPEVPTPHDVLWQIGSAFTDVVQTALDVSATFQTAQPRDTESGYDHATRSWAGDGGLRYRVPLMDVPGEAHTKAKVRNVRVLMDNVRRMCVNDLLPATPEEKQFWSRYRFLKYQMFLQPFCMALPVTYALAKLSFNAIPRLLRGRFTPVMASILIAEQWSEHAYPAHELLGVAMRAKTPLGDCARADWQRLQPVYISQIAFGGYNFRLMIGSPIEEFAFGGNILAASS